MNKMSKFVSLRCLIEDLKYVLINFNLLKFRSHEATVTGRVKNILKAILTFGQVSVNEN